MPTLFELLDASTVGTLNGRTVFPPISAPAWVSALSGMSPDQTGVIHKTWDPSRCVHSPVVRSQTATPWLLYDALDNATTHKAMVASWSWLLKLVDADVCNAALDASGDDEKAVRLFEEACHYDKGESRCSFSFVHFDLIDAAGHKHTWESEAYKDSWVAADGRLKRVLSQAQAHALATNRDLVVIVVSDHGGSGHDHGDITPPHMQIPVIVWQCPTNKHNRTACAIQHGRAVSMLDIAPTVLTFLRADIPQWMRGVSLVQ